MKIEDLKELYGDDYPAAVIVDGVRLPLQRERRFSRSYHSGDMGCEVSRFMEGSASITAPELEREWPGWDDDVRMDFCESCDWLKEQPDFPDMLRFVMRNGGPYDRSSVAMSVACQLPPDEAFDLLTQALRNTEIGKTSNIGQAIALTKHPDAEATLRSHLLNIWEDGRLWDDDEFINWVAFDATTCIAHLIEFGASPADFATRVRQLSEHVCSHNRDSCRGFLSKHYPWLK
jgi:hypothetical protein